MLDRGVEPDTLRPDPIFRTYDDLVQTLENAGYEQGVNLFVANYDWRMKLAPDDGVVDGRIEYSASQMTDDEDEYALDHLGFWLEEAVKQWRNQFPDLPEAEIPELENVDIIAHSMGGLLARSYIQSDAYGGNFFLETENNNVFLKELPKVDNLITIGTPHRGATEAWNPINNNFDGLEDAGRIAGAAFKKVNNRRRDVTYNGGYQNTDELIVAPGEGLQLDPELFIEKYVPTLQTLLPTYPFINPLAGGGEQTLQDYSPGERNRLLLDLNNGDEPLLEEDVNSYVNDANFTTVLYGTGLNTPFLADERNEPEFRNNEFQESIVPLETLTPRVPNVLEIWYESGMDEQMEDGDETVPTISAISNLIDDDNPNNNDPRENIRFDAQAFPGVTHRSLVSDVEVQQSILKTLDINLEENQISSDLFREELSRFEFVTGFPRTAKTLFLDPVEGFLIDGQGRRLGYSEATGAVTEIPNTFWLGDSDGLGFIYGDVEGPFSLELTGLDEDYLVSVSLETEDGIAYLESEGFLAEGEQLTLDVPVNGVNTAPIIDLNGDADGIDATASVPSNGDTSLIADSNLTIFDNESQNLAGATVTIQNPEDGNFELLGATATGNITVDYDATTSILTLDGTDTITNYQQVLSSVTYTNNAANPDTTPRDIEFVVNDGADFNNLSTPATTNVSFLPDGDGGQQIFTIALDSGTTTIYNFGGVGEGINPSSATRLEIDILKFEGAGLIADNLLLTPSGNDLVVSFRDVDNTEVVLADFNLGKSKK